MYTSFVFHFILVFSELNPSLLGFQDGTVYAVHATYIQWPSQGVISQSFHVNLPLPDSILTSSETSAWFT